jgi:hypothetical protein
MELLTPGFSPLKILRVKSQHSLFWLAFRDFPRVEHLCEPEVGSHQRQVQDCVVVVFASEIELAQFHMDLREIVIFSRCPTF